MHLILELVSASLIILLRNANVNAGKITRTLEASSFVGCVTRQNQTKRAVFPFRTSAREGEIFPSVLLLPTFIHSSVHQFIHLPYSSLPRLQNPDLDLPDPHPRLAPASTFNMPLELPRQGLGTAHHIPPQGWLFQFTCVLQLCWLYPSSFRNSPKTLI